MREKTAHIFSALSSEPNSPVMIPADDTAAELTSLGATVVVLKHTVASPPGRRAQTTPVAASSSSKVTDWFRPQCVRATSPERLKPGSTDSEDHKITIQLPHRLTFQPSLLFCAWSLHGPASSVVQHLGTVVLSDVPPFSFRVTA